MEVESPMSKDAAALDGTKDVEYASAVAHFLDRDSQTVKPAMMYPITRVELNEMRGDQIVTVRIFVVNDAGQWIEAS